MLSDRGSDENGPSEQTPDIVGKKERGYARGSVTHLMNIINSIPKDVEHLNEIKEKIESFPEVLQRFEDIHQRYLESLVTEEDKNEAVVTAAEEFEQSIHMWLAQNKKQEDSEDEVTKGVEFEGDEQETVAYEQGEAVLDITQLEDERRRVSETLAALEQARYNNECRLLEERRARLLEQQQIEERLREYETKSEPMKTLNVGPTGSRQDILEFETKSEPVKPVSSTSTPLSSSRRDRLSWEPTGITEAISEVLNESRLQQQSIVDTLQLPRKELQPFDGDTLRYWPFMRSFKTMVDSKSIDVGSKLNCLLQSCTGTARRILNCCEMMEPESGYKRALEILEARYGNNFEIAQKWINKITERSNLKGPIELREFADDLQSCMEMLKNMGHLGELDNTHHLRTIWSKLPQYLQDRWARKNHEIKKQHQRAPRLEDLVRFIVDTAEEATDPVFSRVSFKDYKRDSQTGRQMTREELAVLL